MKILSTEQIRQADAYTIQHEPIASIDLMERAATQLFLEVEKEYGLMHLFHIFAGHGNNGGDGLVLARLLANAGSHVELFVVETGGFSNDTSSNLERLPDSNELSIHYIKSGTDIPTLNSDNIIIDALLGSGLTREPDGLYAEIIDSINEAQATVIAVDIPSGLFGEDNRTSSKNHIIKATLTLTFQMPKLALLLPENYLFVGEWKALPIGLLHEFTDSVESTWNLLTNEDVSTWFCQRSKFDHKGTFGHALLVSGSTGKMGAAVLGARAALLMGAGLVTCHVPAAGLPIIQTAVPEAMATIDTHAEMWTSLPDLTSYQGIGIGPGIGTNPLSGKVLTELFTSATQPLVLDADALNLLSLSNESIRTIPGNSILTPHPGEFRRLFGEDEDDLSRLNRISEMTKAYNLIIVLKGAHTVISDTNGSLWFNNTGNPGMATGGSGDVLTGMITSLLAQGYEPFIAACIGVYLHGLAGDLACEKTGPEALIASDIINHISDAFHLI